MGSEYVIQSLDARACMHASVSLPLRECTQEPTWSQKYEYSSIYMLMSVWTHQDGLESMLTRAHV